MVFDDLSFNTMDFWIHVFNLPSNKHNLASARFIGNYIGVFVDWDSKIGARRLVPLHLRVKVRISTSHRLKSGFFLERDDKPRIWVLFKYERLVDFCYSCSSLSHSDSTCSARMVEIYGPKDSTLAFGP